MEKPKEEVFENDIPILSNENFGLKLNYDQYDKQNAPVEAFPSDYTLASLAHLAYKDFITIPPNLEGWQVLTYASNKRILNGYRGVAFLNLKLCHVVIAHRGTKLTNPGALLSDGELAFKWFIIKHGSSAASFVYLIGKEVGNVNKNFSNAINKDELPPFRLTITGHSLGAWLAQYTTFTLKYLTLNRAGTKFIRDDNYLINIHPHTVVFESPGCKESLDKLLQKLVYEYTHRRYGNYDALDMTVYLNKPNPINCVNRQVGTIYMLPIEGHSIIDVVDYLAMGEVDKEVVLEMKSGILSSITQLTNMIVRTNIQRKFAKIPAKHDRCSLNVFAELELEFVKDWYRAQQYDAENLKVFPDKYKLPNFKLSYEYNLLKGIDFKKVILIIKNLWPDDKIYFKLLQRSVNDQVRLLLFQNDLKLFEERLLDFNGYYFKDKYDLLSFLNSNTQVLQVCVNVDSSGEYEFETSILHNIIKYYQKNEPSFHLTEKEIAFIDWYTLCKYIDSYNIVNNYKLLVIEYYYEDENQNENILKFLQNTNSKVIILLADHINFKDITITEIYRIESKLAFGNLSEKSQEKFLNRRIFILNNQAISLNDLIDNIENGNKRWVNSLSMVSILELILAKDSKMVVLDGQYSNLLKAVLFHNLYYEIQHNQLLENLDNSTVFILREDDTNVDLTNLNNLVYIQSHEDYEEQCFNNIDRTKYLLTIKNSKMYLTSIFNYNFYIYRCIIHKRSVHPDIFQNADDVLDYYIFHGDRRKFEESLISQQENRFKFTLSVDEAVKIARLSHENIHVFKIYQDGTIDWQKSYGSINSLHKYMQSKEVSIKECHIMDDDRIIIISGEPGMGKSSLIEHLYLTLQSKYWIFIIQLKNSNFDEISEELSYVEVAKFITHNCCYNATSAQECLSLCLQPESKRQIYLMFDSFDEISRQEDKIKIINIINFLKNKSNAKILITTLSHVCKQLENGISMFASSFKILNYDTQIVNFLVEFWKSHLHLWEPYIHESQLTIAAENILKSATHAIGDTINTFIEIPMHMRLLAETVTPTMCITSQFSNVLMLYNKYIKQRCDIYIKRFSLEPHAMAQSWLKESILGKISSLSIERLLNVDIQQIKDEEMEELYKIGIIFSDNSNLTYKFLHESVCEYFLSYSIKQWLTSGASNLFGEFDVGKFLISDFFLKEKLKKVRLFLNFHLETDKINKVRVKLCREKLLDVCKNNYNLLCNDKKESIFHVCINENLKYILKYFLLELLDSSNAKMILKETNIGLETPLYYAVNLESADCLTFFLDFLNTWKRIDDLREIFQATFIKKFKTHEHLDKIQQYTSINDYIDLQQIMNEISLEITHI